jgi:superfamily I DNA and RNA helicase
MALEIVVTTDRWQSDPSSRAFVEYVRDNQETLGLTSAVLYYDFPAYVDYETATTRPDVLILSPSHGFFAIRFLDHSLFRRSAESASEIDQALGDFSSNLYSRLLRSRELRKTRTQTIVDVHPIIFIGGLTRSSTVDTRSIESEICGSLEAFSEYVASSEITSVSSNLVAEIRSVVEGAKALSRPQKRVISDPVKQPLAVAISALEAEIANFDHKQRHIALVDVGGPARIRGLAGSGKTVILAMKAAHLHLNNPDSKILITFLTKSLRETIKNLITRFYRHYSETDPDWKNIHVRHGWGGMSTPGVYSDTCKRHNRPPMRLPEAVRLAKRGQTPFGAICAQLQEEVRVQPFYDHILIDEGQDFPASFYQLCYKLSRGERDRKSIVWAYDELQDIMNVKIRQPDELFGPDGDGQPCVDLDRSSRYVPPGATNDAVLSKCYRNQRNILVTAHALGFGVYKNIVQLLESSAHWQDVGYEVPTGELKTGKPVTVVRPDRNSPLPIPDTPEFPLLQWHTANDIDEEVDWVASNVKLLIGAGLAPEEVLVISLDDRHAKPYLSRVSEKLASLGISSNNIIADPYNEPPFTIAGKVSLSTVYRAKGNEAAAVFALGVDAVETRSRDGRNKIFTAFTRSKAWLRVSGIGAAADRLFKELDTAYGKAPVIEFIMPDLKEIDTIQRGFSKKQAAARAARDEFVKKLRNAGFSDDEIEEELQNSVSND